MAAGQSPVDCLGQRANRAGTDATRKIVRACGELGVSYLTIYVFSAENWGRPRTEVTMLMDLMVEMVRREIRDLNNKQCPPSCDRRSFKAASQNTQ